MVRSEKSGYAIYVDAERIIVGPEQLKPDAEDKRTVAEQARAMPGSREYVLRKFTGLNEHTCLNQKPIIEHGKKVPRTLSVGFASFTQSIAIRQNENRQAIQRSPAGICRGSRMCRSGR